MACAQHPSVEIVVPLCHSAVEFLVRCILSLHETHGRALAFSSGALQHYPVADKWVLPTFSVLVMFTSAFDDLGFVESKAVPAIMQSKVNNFDPVTWSSGCRLIRSADANVKAASGKVVLTSVFLGMPLTFANACRHGLQALSLPINLKPALR